MEGKRVALVLGAGASYCYSGESNVPTQQDIVGRLFHGADAGASEGFPSFCGPSGPTHSFLLGQFLRKEFDLPEDPEKRNAKLDFWTALQDRGFNLETFYAELERRIPESRRRLLHEFEAIVRTSVSAPVRERDLGDVCRFHRNLVEALEPGDYVINFNWDSVMADALLYHSHFWFPASGFGIRYVNPLLSLRQKSLPVESLVDLFHVHGSVVLFELEGESKGLLYLGPRQWSPMGGWFRMKGIDIESNRGGSLSMPSDPEDELTQYRLLQLGHIHLDGKWFTPLFMPPSSSKGGYNHWYFRHLRSQIHQRLPTTQKIIIAGYSFPDADINHLSRLFVQEVLRSDLELQVVNMENGSTDFRGRVESVFGDRPVDYQVEDFRLFAEALADAKAEPREQIESRVAPEEKRASTQRDESQS